MRQAGFLAVMALVGVLGWALFAVVFHASAGQDWMVFDTAVQAYFRGDSALLLDGARFTAVLNATHPSLQQPLVQHPWVYPPYTLLLALPFGFLPWYFSYIGFQLASFAGMACSLRFWAADRRGYLLLLAGIVLCPATAFCLGAGQNSFFSASLVLGGFGCLGAGRKVAAGVLLGLLAFKPQLAFLVPVALLAAGAWTSILVAAAVCGVLLMFSLVVPGVALWRGWLHLFLSGDAAFRTWINVGRLKGESVFAIVTLAGGAPVLANAAQYAAILLCAVCVWRGFRPGALCVRGRVALLLCAMVLAAPHIGNYDSILLGIAAMLMLVADVRRATGWGAGLALLAWCAAALNPPAVFQHTIPALFLLSLATPLAVGGLMFWLLGRATSAGAG